MSIVVWVVPLLLLLLLLYCCLGGTDDSSRGKCSAQWRLQGRWTDYLLLGRLPLLCICVFFFYLYFCLYFCVFLLMFRLSGDSKVGRQITFYWAAWLQDHSKPWHRRVWNRNIRERNHIQYFIFENLTS